MASSGDILVHLPQSFGIEAWIEEGDPVGAPWSGIEWEWYSGGHPPRMQPGDRVYVAYKGVLRGYSLLVRIDRPSLNRYSLVRHGGAVAVTIAERIPPTRGFRYRFWARDRELPFPDWADPNAVPPCEVRDIFTAPGAPGGTAQVPVAEMVLSTVVGCLPDYRYRFSDEREFHKGIAAVLKEHNVHYVQEYTAGPKDRFDFLCQGGIVIEAKIKGSFSEAIRQVDRYCARPDVAGVVLVTTRFWAMDQRAAHDATLHGKPVAIIQVQARAF